MVDGTGGVGGQTGGDISGWIFRTADNGGFPGRGWRGGVAGAMWEVLPHLSCFGRCLMESESVSAPDPKPGLKPRC